jgi:hypothetical protein
MSCCHHCHLARDIERSDRIALDELAMELVFRALHGTVGPCRFEAATFRQTGLAIPLVRRAVEVLVGEPLIKPKLYRDEAGRLHGRLAKLTFTTTSTRAMHIIWPMFAARRGLTIRTHGNWIYWDIGEGVPPRLDHLTDARLPYDLLPVDGWWLPDDARDQHDRPVVNLAEGVMRDD